MNPIIIFLAQLLAPICIVAACLMFFRGKLYDKIMSDFKKSPALMYFGGMTSLVVGTLWIMFFFSWDGVTATIFSIIGIMAMVKGIILILFPEVLWKLVCKCEAFKIIGGIIALIGGIWFLSLGYGLF